MKTGKVVGNWLSENWERILFSVVGLVLIGYCLFLVYLDQITNAAAVFGLGFLSFIYANVSRFKRFKGLGFEAELWENKQKEAAELIDRLKNVVSIYTTEVVMGRVKSGRWGVGPHWKENWTLFDSLVEQHDVLGQKIDFSKLKYEMDTYFLFDMCMHNDDSIQRGIIGGVQKAQEVIGKEFGSPVKDIDGYHQRTSQLNLVRDHIEDPFKVGQSGNLAKEITQLAEYAQKSLKEYFGVEVEYDNQDISRLKAIAQLYEHRPVKITNELIMWASKRD